MSHRSFHPLSVPTFFVTLASAVLLASSPAVADVPQQHPDASQVRANGARWLVEHQNADGGWGAGAFGRSAPSASSDVATTSLAVMALLRDAAGEPHHRNAIERGIAFVLDVVERSPADGPRLLGPEGTQPQYKLGRNVDTHFAALLLGEVTGPAGGSLSGDLRTRADVAYDRVLSKVVQAQQGDGSFDSDGWAPVLSSSVAAQSLYKAHMLGKKIEPEVLERSDEYQNGLVDRETGSFDTSAGAGVNLYAAASGLLGNRQAAQRLPASERDRAEQAADAAADAIRRDRGALMSGFGSIGGEEMLSYMMISDSLAAEGGDVWQQWRGRIGNHLAAIQNGDGSWSGHHCITSTPFVTAAAVMTLAAEDAVQLTSSPDAGRVRSARR